MRDFSFDTHIFKEGDAYVAYVPALDVSSCGSTDEEARRNIRDAVRGFLAASADMGTLDEILREAGYEQEGGEWRAPEFGKMGQPALLRRSQAMMAGDGIELPTVPVMPHSYLSWPAHTPNRFD